MLVPQIYCNFFTIRNQKYYKLLMNILWHFLKEILYQLVGKRIANVLPNTHDNVNITKIYIILHLL